MMVSLTQMNYIVKVAELKSFSKAALDCNVSQPSLSLQVQKAEDNLGVVLFDRGAKPLKLSKKGVTLVDQMQNILRESQKLEGLSQTLEKEVSGEFKLAIIPTIIPEIAPQLMAFLVKNYPKLTLVLEEKETSEIVQLFKSRNLDAAVLSTPLHEKDLYEDFLYNEPFLLYINEKHRFYLKESITSKELLHEPLWLLREGHCFRSQALSYCQKKGINPVAENLEFNGNSISTLMSFVDEIGGCTLIPYSKSLSLNQRQKKRLKPLINPIPQREVSLVYHKSFWKEDIRRVVLKALNSVRSIKELKAVKNSSQKKRKTLDIY